MRFENLNCSPGFVPLAVISGKKTNFDVSPVISPGTEAMVSIKQNSRGLFEFGPFSPKAILGGKEVEANMFDAQQAINGKKIKIWQTYHGQVESSLVLTSEPGQVMLSSTRTKHYRDRERITVKDWLGWTVPSAITAVGTIASLLSGLPAA